MKFTFISLLLMLAAGFGQDIDFSKEVAPEQEFTLKVGEQAIIEGGLPGAKLKIRFASVPRDNRCPEGAQCILPGNAKVEIKFKGSKKEALSVILNTDEGPKEVELLTVKVKLIRLNPQPKVGEVIDPNDYEATLVVSRTVAQR